MGAKARAAEMAATSLHWMVEFNALAAVDQTGAILSMDMVTGVVYAE